MSIVLADRTMLPAVPAPAASTPPRPLSNNLIPPPHSTPYHAPKRDEMDAVFVMCRQNRWNSVWDCIRSNPCIPLTNMIMDNHISTTILHQAITSKGDTDARTRCILEVLRVAPQAAAIKNGYGSLPLHVISQRNTKMDAATKEMLINEIVDAYPGALMEQGGVGKRTPLHIIFTDYISPRLTQRLIDKGRRACFMRDRKGYLPAHVACSRHCSPEKLRMLLEVYPGALTAETKSGATPLALAVSSATKSHPNYTLIDDLKRRLEAEGLPTTSIPSPTESPKPSSRSGLGPMVGTTTTTCAAVTPSPIPRKRKITEDVEDDPATLLLHFSRLTSKKMRVAKV